MHGMLELNNKDPSALPRILEIASQEIRQLTKILQSLPFSFAIELASLAFRREYLDFGKWIQDTLQESGAPFGQACIKHAQEKINLLSRGDTGAGPKLFESLVTLYNCLQTNVNVLTPEAQEELKQLSPKFQQLITAPPQGPKAPPPSVRNSNFHPIFTEFSTESLSGAHRRDGLVTCCLWHEYFARSTSNPTYK